jgi:predicted alpha/beta superfamily hydrolase
MDSKSRIPPALDPAATGWDDYPVGPDTTVVGTLKISRGEVGAPGSAPRRLLVYLPPSYATADRRYPVLYMHDGQNLFDAATSYSGDWHVDETMEALSAEGIEAIVVGIPNALESRGSEYTPFPHPYFGGGEADGYLRFLAETVKPLIDRDFRTRPDRAHTGLLGSSLGGLISLYGLFSRPDTFGFAGVVSPAFWWPGEPIFTWMEQAPFVPARIYMDVGDQETPEIPGRREAYVAGAARMAALLRARGYTEADFHYELVIGGQHHESAWAARLPTILRFLLGPLAEASSEF